MADLEVEGKRVSPYLGESDDHSRLSDALTSTKGRDAADAEEDSVYWDKINNAKRDARSEIKLHEWAKYSFGQLDLEKALGPTEDNIEFVHCDDCSLEEMIERFEMPCKPVVIRGLMDRYLPNRINVVSVHIFYSYLQMGCNEKVANRLFS